MKVHPREAIVNSREFLSGTVNEDADGTKVFTIPAYIDQFWCLSTQTKA